jgi:hypothetical protein
MTKDAAQRRSWTFYEAIKVAFSAYCIPQVNNFQHDNDLSVQWASPEEDRWDSMIVPEDIGETVSKKKWLDLSLLSLLTVICATCYKNDTLHSVESNTPRVLYLHC